MSKPVVTTPQLRRPGHFSETVACGLPHLMLVRVKQKYLPLTIY
jgi:hypothetical protein